MAAIVNFVADLRQIRQVAANDPRGASWQSTMVPGFLNRDKFSGSTKAGVPETAAPARRGGCLSLDAAIRWQQTSRVVLPYHWATVPEMHDERAGFSSTPAWKPARKWHRVFHDRKWESRDNAFAVDADLGCLLLDHCVVPRNTSATSHCASPTCSLPDSHSPADRLNTLVAGAGWRCAHVRPTRLPQSSPARCLSRENGKRDSGAGGPTLRR